MKVVAVLPARYGSRRFPGKPLAKINGREMLAWTLEGTAKATKVNEILVATDHKEIASLVEKEGFRAVMTDSELPTGTDRVWAAVQEEDFDIVLNVQGDEPLIDGKVLDLLVDCFQDPNVNMATLGREILNADDLESMNTAKIVLNHKSEALYFSRFPIPQSRERDAKPLCLKHIGIYAFRKDFLKEFCEAGPSQLEVQESLEQLRALYLGATIKVVQVESDSWGVDSPKDILKIENIMKEREENG
ncbi:MAG: 3-deoxy-manno-octulosonate cytidylyltransferase [Bdellovibrionaceae bacterium]|nr:3-deoxy-manno-octulosonate cytidylyltransferase [Pseudobdellovibrionaceae bacterium]|tara:strand:- start:25004 stop:25741 length:738 start_codon:yes stop_codon:yes gene_type:complete